MAHFAKIGMNGKVLNVLTLDDNDMLDANGNSDERVGQQHLEQHNNWPAEMWIQTSYNTSANQHKLGGTPFRGNYAGIGYTWDDENEIFWSPKPYSSWVKDFSTATWKSPIGHPPELTSEQSSQNQAKTHFWMYNWDEENQSWSLTNLRS
jgi:hypothetical protein